MIPKEDARQPIVPGTAAREPYEPPQLIQHGSIEDLTQALAGGGSDNSPGMPNGSNI